ncbi:MAG TPA: DNA internalization-related competence protein ComEC/Rec2 [Usitatibacter sp.]|nr:DNA internalization-related competence protein ComEC/Rec2 [Usitatibacter sp.]
MRLFALAFVAGAFLLQQQRSLPDAPFALLGLAGAAAWLLCARRPLLGAGLAFASGLLLGFGYAAWRAELRLAEALPAAMEGRDVVVTGIVSGLPQERAEGTRFLFDVEDWGAGARNRGELPSTLSLAWYAHDATTPRVAACERWRLAVRLKRPHGLANPHGFDFESWALERGIRATGYVRDEGTAARLSDRVDGWPCLLHRWRGVVRARMLERLAQAPRRGVLVALAIGDQDSIPESDWETFWRTGVGHLMSISGLHITMLAALGFAATAFLWVRVPRLALRLPARKAAAVAGLVVAAAYTLMTGYAVPAQRTLAMLATVAACVIAGRRASPSRTLAAAAIVVVALDPWAVLAPGFWLSFGAVASIFYAMDLRTGRRGKLAAAFLEQLAVTLVMLPMLVALFQQVSLVSPLANAFAIPVVSLGVVPLTIAGAFLPLPWLLDVAHALLQLVMAALGWLAALPSAVLESHAPQPWTVACAVTGCLWMLAPRGFPMRSCALAWIAPLFLVAPPGPAPGEAWIDVLDVGNGLAVVVRTAGHALAYDTGPSWNGDADTGSRIVVPFLRGEGIARLDALVISHADDDHSGGAASVAASRDPRWMLSSLPAGHPLHDLVAPSFPCEAGEGWRWDGVDFRVLHPPASIYAGGARRKENDRGCVIRVATAAHSMLLAADVEARSESEMLARDPAALASDVLLVPHHGSRTSSTEGFVDAVSPAVAIFSVGYRNRFHHPHPMVVARYAARGVERHRTDEEGALRMVLPARGGAQPVITGQEAACRYWSARSSCSK